MHVLCYPAKQRCYIFLNFDEYNLFDILLLL